MRDTMSNDSSTSLKLFLSAYIFLRDHFDVLYQGENSVFVSAVIA